MSQWILWHWKSKIAELSMRDLFDQIGFRIEVGQASRSLTEQRRREIQEWCEGVAEYQKGFTAIRPGSG
jgi:hypothetical protein